MILSAFNPSLQNLEKSYLSRSYSVGVTSIVLRNNDNFGVNSRILIGELGSENAEIVTVSAVNVDKVTITVGATKFPHSASDPVYVLTYDQIRIYRSTTTVDGVYTVLATVPIDVDNKSLKTAYNDALGLPTYFYKISFYHSIAAVESELSDPIPGEGYNRKQVGTLVHDFLQEVGDLEQEYITIPAIIALLNECNEDIIGQSRRPYRFLRKSTLATITAGNDRIDLPTDIVKLDRVKYNRVDGVVVNTSGNLSIISEEEMEYYQYEPNMYPMAVGQGIQAAAIDETDNQLVLFPKPVATQTDKIKIYYWGEFPVLTSLADALLPPVARIYKMFLLGRFYRIRAKKESSFLQLSDRYLSDYNGEIVKLQRAQKVDIGTPMSFKPDTRTSRGMRR